MTVEISNAPPLSVQSSKLIEWLISRKLLQNDFLKRLDTIKKKYEQLADNSAGSDSQQLPLTYFYAKETAEAIEKEDTTTDFFGRASQAVRNWRDIVDSYEKANLHIAEASEQVQELASEHVPKCKSIVTDRQKLITDLRLKIKERSLNVMNKEEVLGRACKEFRIEVSEKHIKMRLLEEASKIPEVLSSFVLELNELENALILYDGVNNFIRNSFHNSTPAKKLEPSNCCPTLKLLIRSGHVRLFTWQTGREPERIEADDDFVPRLLSEEHLSIERSLKEEIQPTTESEAVLELGTADLDNIAWGDTTTDEIDFGGIEVEDATQIDIELVDADHTTNDDDVVHVVRDGDQLIAQTDIASGKTARFLLDTTEGRTALLNELVELSAFLTRWMEDLIELQGIEGKASSSMETRGSAGGSATLQNMIIQNAPASIQSVSAKEASDLLSKVERARAQLTNSSISQLLMIRNKPGFLDRVTGRLADIRRQVTRAKSRVAEAQIQIDEAVAEQELQAVILVKHRNNCKQLVRFLEKELTRLCNRRVQIIGQVLDL